MSEQKYLRKIRSFVRREGRLTKGQQRALDQLYPLYGLDLQQHQQFDFASIYQNDHPVKLEIGFGNGKSFIQMAADDAQSNYLGIEVHRPGVGNALLQIEEREVTNVRVICDDAVEVLNNHIAGGSLSAIFIFFPDPWHKKRHHKRRLIQMEFVELLHKKLKRGGILHFATDWQHYAEQMLEVMQQASGFANMAADNRYSERPDYRPLTKFEQRGIKLGHGVWDLLYRKD